MSEKLWQPSNQRRQQANLTRFIHLVGQHNPNVTDYDHLYTWSVEQSDQFWSTFWQFADIKCSQPWDSILDYPDKMPGAKWFSGARLNFAENLLKFRDSQIAISFVDERHPVSHLTYAELYQEVAFCVEILKGFGLKQSDRVAGYMSNHPYAVIAMLATTSLGAIWSSCSPDFGVKGVLERFTQIEPKILFSIDGYTYNGKQYHVLDTANQIVKEIPSIKQAIIVPFLARNPVISGMERTCVYPAFFVDRSSDDREIQFAQLPFDHPLYILYSSGTTGKPKCIVHSAGGTLIQHLKEHQLHTDIKRQDRLFYFTTCGWMMWNWLVSGLASGCTVVLYDGSPFFAKKNHMWQLVEDMGITIFGTSARYIAASAKYRLKPKYDFNLSSLHTILSTGSPLVAEYFDYVYKNIKQDVMLSSISGGTDIISCFVLGTPLRCVYRGEIQSRGLGMAVDVYDEGKPVHGQQGELVCTKPFPSMPIGFWGESDNSRYHDAYFARFDHVWAQGDFAEITEHDGVIIYGRSDAVLNPGGIRIGTAEIYRQVEKVDEVLESLCIAQKWKDDVRVVLFVLLREDVILSVKLEAKIRDTIKQNTTLRHVPKKIVSVADIPRTRSGKIVELAVRDVVHGRPVKNMQALENPEAMDYFVNISELQQD